MSADHLEFLKSKFMEDLRDAEEEHTGENEIPLHSLFLQIRHILEFHRSFTQSTPIGMKDCLYNAISALEECVILSEKREPRKKDGPLHGYTLAELWLLRRTKKLLLKIKKKLVSTRENAVESSLAAASSSSISLPRVIPRPDSDWRFIRLKIEGFDGQEKEIIDELVDGKKRGKGFKKIGIVGIGGSGKTTLAQLVFTNYKVVRFFHYRIWVCLSQTLTARDGDVDLKQMVREMLEQCGVEYDRLQEEDEDKLLENLKSVLMGETECSYLIVFDGIWDIKMEWYLKLGEKLEWFDNHRVKVKVKERESESSSGGVIITTRLPHIPKQMGIMHLHHMAPLIPQKLWDFFERTIDSYFYMLRRRDMHRKMGDEVVQQSDGLPLAAEILGEIIPKKIFGERHHILANYYLVAMVNSEDDAIFGKDFLLQLRDLTHHVMDQVIDVSEHPLLDVFNILNQHAYRYSHDKNMLKALVVSGDAKANRLLQLISNLKIDPKPPIAVMPLGSQTDFSLSLGWRNHTPSPVNLLNVSLFVQEVFTVEERIIDSWNFEMTMRMIPNGLLEAFSYPSTSEANLTHMGGDKRFKTTFWSYFIIGMDDQEWSDSSSHEKMDEVFTINSCCKSWPRIDALAISIKIKDQQGQWKEINIPHSIKSIVCLNLPCFLDEVDPWERPNVKKKRDRNFTPSYVDDRLLEVIGFRDSWHGCGTRLAQVDQIRFELYKATGNHIYMSIDGNKWKQPLPIDDDSFFIEISHLHTTKMLMTSDSKCKFKVQLPLCIPKEDELSLKVHDILRRL